MRPDVKKIVSKPRLMFRPDPVLGWRFTPNHAVQVSFRDHILQHIDQDGWRYVPNQPTGRVPRLAFYGCSFTYGAGLGDDETFTSLLQRERQQIKILNRGLSGHGTTQNLLQFRRDIAAGSVDAAIFAIISDHRFRNIAHPQRMQQYLNREWYELGVEQVPVARLTAQGWAEIIYVPLWQPAIRQTDFSIFLPDDYMINVASHAVLDRVKTMAREANIPLRFVVLDQLDMAFTKGLISRFPDIVDISTPYDDAHTFKPLDIHPNRRANELFAERLLPLVDHLMTGKTGVSDDG